MTPGPEPTGWPRSNGSFGIRNHILALPSVVCSTHAAGLIAAGDAATVSITHQHGCLHVGDDLRHTERELLGTAASANVGACVVVGLGCETIQGRRLARRLSERGQRVEFVGIQAAGGTSRAVEEGQATVARLSAELGRQDRGPIPRDRLVVGIEPRDDARVEEIAGRLAADGIRSIGLEAQGPEGHVALVAAGAQVIVSLLPPDEAPTGFAVCPVIAVACDSDLHRALEDDFDVGVDAAASGLADRVATLVSETSRGAETAAERRGSREFVLRRLARTM